MKIKTDADKIFKVSVCMLVYNVRDAPSRNRRLRRHFARRDAYAINMIMSVLCPFESIFHCYAMSTATERNSLSAVSCQFLICFLCSVYPFGYPFC